MTIFNSIHKKIILILFFLCSTLVLSAQTTVPAKVSYTLSPMINLVVNTLDNSAFNFTTADMMEFGIIKYNRTRVLVKSNKQWMLQILALNADFTVISGSPSTDVPANLIQIKRHSDSNFYSLSNITPVVMQGNRGDNFTQGNTFQIDMKMVPGFNYDQGSYRLNIVYTLTQL